jgi:hypothetical protein
MLPMLSGRDTFGNLWVRRHGMTRRRPRNNDNLHSVILNHKNSCGLKSANHKYRRRATNLLKKAAPIPTPRIIDIKIIRSI